LKYGFLSFFKFFCVEVKKQVEYLQKYLSAVKSELGLWGFEASTEEKIKRMKIQLIQLLSKQVHCSIC